MSSRPPLWPRGIKRLLFKPDGPQLLRQKGVCVLPCRGWGGVSPQDGLLPAQKCRGSLGCTVCTPQPFLGPANPTPRLITPCTIPMHGHLTLPKNPCLHWSCRKGSREEERCQVGNRRICLGSQKGLADLPPTSAHPIWAKCRHGGTQDHCGDFNPLP